MPREHGPGGSAPARWLDGLRRRLARALLGQELQPILDWIKGAEIHLAALQKEYEQLRGPAGEGRRDDLQPVLLWIHGAEAHLKGLQTGHDYLKALPLRQSAQLDRLTARAASLESRIADLERMDTEIAIAFAKTRVSSRQ